MKMTNAKRADYANTAVNTYARVKEGRYTHSEQEEIAADLISDLLHLINRRADDGGQTARQKLKLALDNFIAELIEEDSAS